MRANQTSSTSVYDVNISPVNVDGLDTKEGKSQKASIAGGIVGGLAGLGIFIAGLLWYLRRRRVRKLLEEREYADYVPFRETEKVSTPPPMLSIESRQRPLRLLAPPEKGYAIWEKQPIESTVAGTDLSMMPDYSSSTGWSSTLVSSGHEMRRELLRQNTELRVEVVHLRRVMERMQDGSVVGTRSVATSLPRYQEPSVVP